MNLTSFPPISLLFPPNKPHFQTQYKNREISDLISTLNMIISSNGTRNAHSLLDAVAVLISARQNLNEVIKNR